MPYPLSLCCIMSQPPLSCALLLWCDVSCGDCLSFPGLACRLRSQQRCMAVTAAAVTCSCIFWLSVACLTSAPPPPSATIHSHEGVTTRPPAVCISTSLLPWCSVCVGVARGLACARCALFVTQQRPPLPPFCMSAVCPGGRVHLKGSGKRDVWWWWPTLLWACCLLFRGTTGAPHTPLVCAMCKLLSLCWPHEALWLSVHTPGSTPPQVMTML